MSNLDPNALWVGIVRVEYRPMRSTGHPSSSS